MVVRGTSPRSVPTSRFRLAVLSCCVPRRRQAVDKSCSFPFSLLRATTPVSHAVVVVLFLASSSWLRQLPTVAICVSGPALELCGIAAAASATLLLCETPPSDSLDTGRRVPLSTVFSPSLLSASSTALKHARSTRREAAGGQLSRAPSDAFSANLHLHAPRRRTRFRCDSTPLSPTRDPPRGRSL